MNTTDSRLRAKEAPVPEPTAAGGIGLVLLGLLLIVLLFLMAGNSGEAWGALILTPVLVAVILPALHRQADREGDPRLLRLLLAALLLKLIGAVVRHYVAFDIYEGEADAGDYHAFGVEVYQQFRSGNFQTNLPSLTSTHFIEFLTGLVYAVAGPSQLGGFLVYSWLGFWGLLFFYRAFTLAVPQGRSRMYARLLFFLPSLVYWPSSIGKEAWMTLTLGLAALGIAHALTGKTIRGLSIAGLGLWLAALARPHFAGIMAVAIVAGFLFRRSPKELGALAPIAKVIALVGISFVAIIFVHRADEFLRQRGIDREQGVTTALNETTERTSQGGSQFVPSILDAPQRAPVATFTVLFRPVLAEAHNTQALAAAAEVTVLLLISLFRWRSFLVGLQSLRSQPYVAFAFSYSGLMVLALSSIANFGILARQRIQLLPIFLVLLCLDTSKKQAGPGPAEPSAEGARKSALGVGRGP